MNRYLRTLIRALKGESLCSFESLALTTRHANAITGQLDQARKERNEIRTRYETLVAECTRHRHATWEITHR